MINKSKLIYTSLVLLTLSLPAQSTAINEDDLCAPFENSKIDQSLIATMLEAATDGHLYQIKNDSSKMGFCVNSPVGMVNGNFKNFNGGIALNQENKQTIVKANVGSLETDVPFTEKMIKSEQFFDAKTFPELMFISSEFEWLSETQGVLKGKLSMHGVTKSVAFYVEITETEPSLDGSRNILVKATTTVLRSEFDMNALSTTVSDKVNICMSIEAERYQSI